MFERCLVESAHAGAARKPAAVVVSAASQAALLALVALLSLRQLALPPRALLTVVSAPILPFAAAPPRLAAPAAVTRLAVWNPAPPAATAPPPLPAANSDPVAAPATLLPGDALSPPRWEGLAPAPPAPPPPATSAPSPRPGSGSPLRVGGDVLAARCLFCPAPSYPALARQLGLEGTVSLHARIGADGRVEQLRTAGGNALLAQAAAAAVGRWRYRPVLLDGQPVVVETVITVRFVLGGG